MKPFNLEKALAGEPVVTRDGCEVEIAGRKKGVRSWPVVGWIHLKDGEWEAYAWNESGERFYSINDDTDLFMADQKKTVWIRCYVNVDGGVIVRSDDYKDSAIFKESMILSNCKWIDPEPWPHEVSI